MSCLAALTQVGHVAVCVPETGDVKDTHRHMSRPAPGVVHLQCAGIGFLCAEGMQGASKEPYLVPSHYTRQWC